MNRLLLLCTVYGLLPTAYLCAADVGVLVLAHGGSAQWNQTVNATVAQAQLDAPTEVAFGMGMHEPEVAAIQGAVDALAARGVSRIVAIPLLISSSSEVLRQYQYLLGLREHGPWEEHAKPVTIRVPLVMAQPLDDDPIVADILLERALELSTHPDEETVVVVAHGPNEDADNAQWLAVMGRLSQQVQAKGHFRAVIPATLRDDAPTPVREAATRSLRRLVAQQNHQGRTLIVPLLLASGGIEAKISKRLKGLRYVYEGHTLLPHPKLAQWIAQRVRQAPAPVAKVGQL